MEGVTPEIFGQSVGRTSGRHFVLREESLLMIELRERRKGELEIRTRTQTKLKHPPPFERNARRLKE
ncbi:hypothetical protein JOB18_015843 [Solea senegalensis]|uniref:Uncharacterized protein n=1 Tax=Solea senegalensis TaxID=28829 RepID=A0AAV6QE98_SOLSE|nr:hypothetical protein JOB18_015843 [Solea senegalensis]